jgi:hypothetical protein
MFIGLMITSKSTRRTYQSMLKWYKVVTDADFPFLSNDNGKSLVFGPVLEAVLSKSDIKKRTEFYLRLG